LVDLSTSIWYNEVQETDWRESFTHHPKYDVPTEKFAEKNKQALLLLQLKY
jgi:hypothetical protein